MKKQMMGFWIIALFITVELSGCDQLIRDTRFVGSWKDQSNTMSFMFLSNGTVRAGIGTSYSVSGKWNIIDKKLVIDFNQGIYLFSQKTEFNYAFSNNDKTLTLTEVNQGTASVYTRQ